MEGGEGGGREGGGRGCGGRGRLIKTNTVSHSVCVCVKTIRPYVHKDNLICLTTFNIQTCRHSYNIHIKYGAGYNT